MRAEEAKTSIAPLTWVVVDSSFCLVFLFASPVLRHAYKYRPSSLRSHKYSHAVCQLAGKEIAIARLGDEVVAVIIPSIEGIQQLRPFSR